LKGKHLPSSDVLVVVHTFNPSTWEAEAGGFLSSRPARTTQRNPVSNNQKKKKKVIFFFLKLMTTVLDSEKHHSNDEIKTITF
jgi:hypothetical protein